mgnify:CR=1 FL=1
MSMIQIRIFKMIDTIITEVGFILLGGAVAFIPIYLLGLVLREKENV